MTCHDYQIAPGRYSRNLVLFVRFHIQTIILPSQARDKHRESTQNKGVPFSCSTGPAVIYTLHTYVHDLADLLRTVFNASPQLGPRYGVGLEAGLAVPDLRKV